MEFKMISVAGKLYGQSQHSPVDRSPVELVDFKDGQFFKDLASAQYEQSLLEFMIHLAVCHTIITTKDDEGQLKYNASSPDELALVNGAKFCGFQFLGNDEKGYLVVRHKMKYFRYQVL
jgi:phospholipid-transporting ATPase